MGILGAVAGGLAGLATGGPVGAAVGALGGLGSGGDTSSSSGSFRVEERMNLADWTPEQRYIVENAMNSINKFTMGMNPAQAMKLKQGIYDAMFGTAKDALTSEYNRREAEQQGLRARRGQDTSTSKEDALLSRARLAREVGLASNQATLGAESAFQQERATRINEAMATLQALSEMWNERKAASTIVKSGTSNSQTTTPDTSLSSSFGAFSSALGDSSSWWNTGGSAKIGKLLGLGSDSGLTPHQQWAWTTDTVGD